MDFNFTKLLRVYSGISQTEMSKLMGIVRTYLCRLEKNDKTFSINLISKMAEGIGVSADALFLAIVEPPPELGQIERDLFETIRTILRMRILTKAELTHLKILAQKAKEKL